MKKRETTLLIVLGLAVAAAIVVFILMSRESAPEVQDDALAVDGVRVHPAQSVEQLMNTINTASSVLQSDKFLMLVTYGKVPVAVEPEEVGKPTLF